MSKELLNTLFVMTPGAFAKLDGDTVRVDADGQKLIQAPLIHLGQLVFFGGASLTPALMHRCAAEGREITFLDFSGRFKCRLVGPTSGNVLLRKAQYDAHACDKRTLSVVLPIVAGKVKNTRNTLLRAARESTDAEGATYLTKNAEILAHLLTRLPHMPGVDAARGIEGQAAACYFAAFPHMITREKGAFAFANRTRRPPRDRVNAMLSFVYALLTADCVAAVEGVGLDPQFGYLHVLRPGRPALALDLAEEFRSYLADRLVLTLINRRQIEPHHFDARPADMPADQQSVLLNEDGRKIVLAAYQRRKQEEVQHPLLKMRAPLGLVPFLQARILARHLRGELPAYLPFVPK